jgi:hypothetical protein
MRYPEYKVCWIKKETCICGHEINSQLTYSFFNAENALKHAENVLKEGCTILYIEL